MEPLTHSLWGLGGVKQLCPSNIGHLWSDHWLLLLRQTSGQSMLLHLLSLMQDPLPLAKVTSQRYKQAGPQASQVALVVMESTCQSRRHKRCRFDHWVRKIPWRRAWQPTLAFLPGKSHGRRSLSGCSPWSHKLSDTETKQQQGCFSPRPQALYVHLLVPP